MKKRLRFTSIFSLIFFNSIFAQTLPPKREFRGAWITTVINLDWPSAPGLNASTQRGELIRLLDELQAAGINAVMFQVRSECDAMYISTLEPWSFWLTGQQGRAPSPFYDPLQFAVEEAHRRGMELHAWFNPYRSVREINTYPNDPNHVSIKHPDWIIQAGTHKILDPGLPMVRAYVTSVVMDVVNRYDVDGVHFDDYFYPYPPDQLTTQDNATFANYPRGFTNRGDWRRDNVNLLVKMVHDSIQAVKPHVKFGISPFGIWRSGVPFGITGLDAYNTIYCDATTWLKQQTIDYLTPQFYWPFGGGQDYGKLMPWWASQMNGRHLYPGQAVYRIPNWAANEMPRQIRLNRSTPNALGSVFFRALNLRKNPKSFSDSLKTNLYRHPALSPAMKWKEAVPPNVPQNLRYERIAGTGSAGLHWEAPPRATDGDAAFRYVVYRFDHPAIQPSDLNDANKIVAIAGLTFNTPKTPPPSNTPYYYAVTALDRNSNESLSTNAIMVLPPPVLLAFPTNGASVGSDGVTLRWNYPHNAASYQLQVGRDSTFTSSFIVNESGLVDTFKVIPELEGQTTYYWRVQASNAGGVGAFSEKRSFTTRFPAVPAQVSPTNNVREVAVNPTLVWRTAAGATAYHFQIAGNSLFDTNSLVYDIANIADTSYKIARLEINKFYFWRVRATNPMGVSAWSTIWRFKTIETTGVEETPSVPATLALYQNYPNPFNPITTIVFDLPESGTPQLIIYDIIGHEVLTLLNEPRSAGRHEVSFYADDLPSGVYYYRLKFEGQVLTKKMTILK